MGDPTVREALRQLEFLSGISEGLFTQLESISQLCSFSAGGVLFRQGEPAIDLHLVLAGLVSLEICAAGVGCKRILTIGPGDLVGWSPVLKQGKLTATARAMAVTQTIKLAGPAVLAICDQDPRFGYEFMQRTAVALAKRLNATRLQLLDVYGSAMPLGHTEQVNDAARASPP